MFTGRDALLKVEQAVSRVRSDEGQLDQTLRSAMEKAARLRRDEAQGFRLLARIKLDALIGDKVIANLDATERRALEMIEKHRSALEELSRKRDEAQRRLSEAEAEKHKRDLVLVQALNAIDQLRQQVAEHIKGEANWQAAEGELDAASKIAENADRKASTSETDLAAKRKPYEDDPLFIYLWQKKHGQSADTSWPLVRYFDHMVARRIGFLGARANYTMLLDIPLRLREHANEKQKDVEAAKDRVAELERKALVADGVEPLEAQAEVASSSVKDAEVTVVKITNELKQIEAARQQALGSGDDAVYSKAVDMLAQAFTQQDLRKLYQQALRTPAEEDEQAVTSIAKTREELGKVDTEVDQIRAQIREMARRRVELEGARDRARRQGYDNPLGNYGGGQDAIGQVIGGILGGMLAGSDLDRVLRDNYRYPIPRSDPDFGGWRRQTTPWTWGGGRTFPRNPSGGGWSTGGGF